MFLRNKLYDYGIYKSKELNSRVISVGNVSAGGTGKTPFVEMLAELLIKQAKFVAIISKGYKREIDDIKVSELSYKNEEKKLNTENFGDEPLMLLENLSLLKSEKGLMVVGDKKITCAKFADAKFDPDVIIVDDGFQHRKLHRELDIVILNNENPKHLIPAGMLREPFKNIRRANLIVLNTKFEGDKAPGGLQAITDLICGYTLDGFCGKDNLKHDLKEKNMIAFCGIADPDSFKYLLAKENIKLAEFITFSDHHNFTYENLTMLSKTMKEKNADGFITTQKDFIRLKYSGINTTEKFFNDYPLYYAKIKMQILKGKEKLEDKLEIMMR